MFHLNLGHSNTVASRVARIRRTGPFVVLPLALAAIVGTLSFRSPSPASLPESGLGTPFPLPAGWNPPPVPADNPISIEKFVLGRQLFYETELSGDNSTSCASCHRPEHSFSDANHPTHEGAFGVTSSPGRTAPRLVNVAYDSVLTWDGHLHSLEDQVRAAVVKKGDFEADPSIVCARLAGNPAYTAMFEQAFGTPEITLDRIAMAVATFERFLISGNSPYDQYLQGNTAALSGSALRGMNLFFDTLKTNCSQCHGSIGGNTPNAVGNLMTDNRYYSTGTFDSGNVHYGGSNGDSGRAMVTHKSGDVGKFRTPTLRNVALTPPYGAAGSVQTLAEVVANYSKGGISVTPNRDKRIRPLNLTSSEQKDIVAFLQSMTDSSFLTRQAFKDPGPPVLSVDDHTITKGLATYPNPTTGSVTVDAQDLAGAVDIRLVSERGATVWHRTVVADGKPFQLDLARLPAGAYRMDLAAGKIHRTSKIVIER